MAINLVLWKDFKTMAINIVLWKDFKIMAIHLVLWIYFKIMDISSVNRFFKPWPFNLVPHIDF